MYVRCSDCSLCIWIFYQYYLNYWCVLLGFFSSDLLDSLCVCVLTSVTRRSLTKRFSKVPLWQQRCKERGDTRSPSWCHDNPATRVSGTEYTDTYVTRIWFGLVHFLLLLFSFLCVLSSSLSQQSSSSSSSLSCKAQTFYFFPPVLCRTVLLREVDT